MKYKLPLGMAVIVVMLLAACNNLFDAPSDQLPAGYGRVSINITGGETERTVLPATGLFDSVKYFFKKGSEAEKEIQPETANGNTFKLENGTYTVRIEAYVGTTKVAEGTSASFTVATSGTTPNPVTVKLNPNETVATGTFEYNVTHPANTKLTMSLIKWNGTNNELGNIPQGSGTPIETTGTKADLNVGSYVLTVTLKDNTTDKYAGIVEAVHIYPSLTTKFIKRFNETDLITPATHGITLYESGKTDNALSNPSFGSKDKGYTESNLPAALSVDVKNNGNQPTGALTVALSGTNADSFTLSKTSIDSIAGSQTSANAFTVQPKTGLDFNSDSSAKDYTATVTVSGGNSITAAFTVSFKVTNPSVPSFGINLDKSGVQTFTEVTYGYAAPTALTVKITNKGNQATGALTIALSGGNTSDFTLSKTSITDIAKDGNDTFTVVPKTDLNFKNTAYTDTVKVSAADGNNNEITEQTFTVSFTVNAKDISSTDIILDPATIPDQVYTGNGITPTINSVKDGDKTLSSTDDYTVGYNNNTAINDNKTAKVTIEGKGNYKDKRELSFNIKAPFTLSEGSDTIAKDGILTFTEATAGYTTAPAAKTITINNVNPDTAINLTAALDSTGTSNFTLTSTSISTINGNTSGTFTVQPKTGLVAETYEATISITGVKDYTFSFKVSFKVNAAPAVTGVTVSPSTANVAKGGTQQFSASVTGNNNQASTVTWTVEGGISETGISTAGLLTVAAGETATTLTVKATSTVTTSVSGTASVTVTGGSGGGVTEVTLSSVSQDGSHTGAEHKTTKTLTLTFSETITGLSANDITLTNGTGVTGTISKGTLSGPEFVSGNSGPVTYTLPISGFTAGGTLEVSVSKENYTFKYVTSSSTATKIDVNIIYCPFDSAVGLTTGAGTYGGGTHSFTGGILTISGNGGFSVDLPAGFTVADTVNIQYVALNVTEPIGDSVVKFISKQGSGWTDLSPAAYPQPKIDQIDTITAKGFSAAGLKDNKKAFFQTSGSFTAKIKIISVGRTEGPPLKITASVPGLKPSSGGNPETTTETDEFTGAVSWAPTVTGTFAQGTEYTATIVLTKKAGYTFADVAANAIGVVGAKTVTHPAGDEGTLTITAAFDATAAPAPDITITNIQSADIGAVGGSVVVTDTNGFTLTQSAGYDGSYGFIKVDFDEYTLGDYSNLDFTFTGIEGDIVSKSARVWITDTVPTGSKTESDGVTTAAGNGNASGGTNPTAATIALTKFSGIAASKVVYVAFNLWAKTPGDDIKATAYTISDIKFHHGN